MICDVGEVTERLENELCCTYISISMTLFILQPFRHFTYVTAHSPTLPSLYLRHSSFSNYSVGSPTSQFILQLFLRFSYVRGSSLTSPGEPPMFLGFINMMNNGEMDHGNENSTYQLPWWLRKSMKRNPVRLVGKQEFNSGSTEYEFILSLSQLAR